LLAHGRWFSPGTPASSTTKTCRHDIAEILLKVALNTNNQSINQNTLHYLKDAFLLLMLSFFIIKKLLGFFFFLYQINFCSPFLDDRRELFAL
jgi:hypothetical protein